MKYLPLFLIFLISCQSGINQKKQIQNTDSIKVSKSESIKINESKPQIDSSSFDYFLSLTRRKELLPPKLVDSFINLSGYSCYGSGLEFYKIDTITVAFIRVIPDDVCDEISALTFTENGQLLDSKIVESVCDSDGENTFGNRFFKIYADSILEISLESGYEHYMIKTDGKFEQFFENIKYAHDDSKCLASYRVLSIKDLENLSKKDLRILRNEVFARKGYRFKSQDLWDYFSQFEWYRPRYDEISKYWFTPVQKYNIELILKLEKKYAR